MSLVNGLGSVKDLKPDTTEIQSVPQITIVSTDNHSEGNIDSPTGIKKPSISEKCKLILESSPAVITMNIATIYALFGDDIKTLGFPKSADDVFSSLVVICLFLFTAELIFSFILKPGYKWSFYFWLDLIATLSLVPDIGWMWDAALGLDSGKSDGKSVKDAGNASRAGARTARVFRIIRMVRLIRIVKLYKNILITLEKKKQKLKVDDDDELIRDLPVTSESKVGNKMSEVTMKRVIIIVMAMLFILPLFDNEFYFNFQTSWEYGLVEIRSFYDNGGYENVTDKYIDFHKDDIRPLVYLRYLKDDDAHIWEGDTPFYDLRYNEIYYTSTGEFISIFDTRFDARLTSLLNIIRTIFICIILTLGSIYFSKDSDTLVIKPIGKMIEKVKIIAKNPIAAAEIQDLYNNQEEEKPSSCLSSLCKSKSSSTQYETQLLENTIMKIGVLLALGFGEAGSLIIGSNIEKGGEMDPMIEGKKVVGIYGFCDIRNFTDATEELQEGVMMFVNEIAQVVHGIVDKYLGAANKNIGDAFLLVWKFSNDEFFLDENNGIVRNPESARTKYLPDLSLLSFLKIMAKVNKDPAMLKYRTNQRLISRMPGYEVKMGFGLHLGWSIEGAIGSQFKIDASYLSPNVNVASVLEASTKMYGVPLLISGTLYQVFSEPVQKYCRQIDQVLIRGHSDPLPLFTSDCEFFEFIQGKQADRSKNFFRKKRKALKRDLEKFKITTEMLYSESKEIKLMKKHFSIEFFQMFQEAFQFYLNGAWNKAKLGFEQVLTIRQKDGPTQALLGFMAEYGFICPTGWKQVRNLT
jgi:class 3 adenylate cyclase